jgi:type II secretory pathway component PulK
MISHRKNQSGMALIVTLLAVVLITALVVEFSYGVFIGTSNLYNWRDSQRLSLMAQSGMNVSAKLITDALKDKNYSYPGILEYPIENPFQGFNGRIMIRIEDEGSKFNLNALVPWNELVLTDDPKSPYNCFRRLLRALSLDEKITDRIADWIDSDKESRLADSERESRNSVLLGTDELLLIPGINREDYNTLLPYITVYGSRDNISININGAEKPVLRCLSEKITDELAQRVVDFRQNNPFQTIGELDNVAGFGGGMEIPAGVITVKGEHFSIVSEADSGGVKRIIRAVLNATNREVEYWKEY